MNKHANYFNYLRSRGRLGYLYRTRYLYPRLSRHISGRVLDVGCGIGDFLNYRHDTVGVDVNPHTVEWCRQHGLNCHLMEADHLPFNDCSFESVVLDNVLEHVTSPQPLLSEIRRVLRPGGQLLVGVPGLRGYSCDPDHKVYYDDADLERVVCTAGFFLKLIFHMPVKSRLLNAWLSQYCVYSVFERA